MQVIPDANKIEEKAAVATAAVSKASTARERTPRFGLRQLGWHPPPAICFRKPTENVAAVEKENIINETKVISAPKSKYPFYKRIFQRITLSK